MPVSGRPEWIWAGQTVELHKDKAWTFAQGSMNQALSLSSQMLRAPRRGRCQKVKPRVGSQARSDPGRPPKPTPASPSPSHASCAGPAPIPPQVSGFPALACPGLLTRAAAPRQQPARDQGGGRLGPWCHPSVPQPFLSRGTEARSPSTVCGPRCLSP